ncbi:MAG TPA: VOC family protein [Nitrososphaerales archaeon]|nr:VOC family protein [Nitrososphaerales archaeon]
MDSKLSARAAARFVMHEGMTLGAPTLRVRHLGPMLDFYVGSLGLHARKVEEGASGLKAVELRPTGAPGQTLLTLTEDPKARQAPSDSAGLYHYAALVPDRRSLASTLVAIGSSGVAYEGFADHQVSESLYLHDVERNGIEIYADRPRSAWSDWRKISERIAATGDLSLMAPMSQPLDVESLVRELGENGAREKPTAFPTGARIGHVHLRVTDLERSVKFYHETLGLEVMMHVPQMGAAFLSAGGYHHHIGLNTWHSLGGTPHEDGDAGLDEFRIIVPERAVLDEVARRVPGTGGDDGSLAISDPDGIRVTIVPQTAGPRYRGHR